MDAGRHSIARRAIRAALACAAALALTIVMTWPLAAGFGRLGRTLPGDGPYAIWNVAWVAHALTTDPGQLLDANIFHPHRRTLAYSEMNLVAGLVGVPGWLATRNPYVAHNSALMFAFASSVLGAWLLARRLSGSAQAAAVAAILYGCTPYFFAHTPHIQLLMGGGIPVAMLLMYRVAEAPSPRRGAALGAALAVQALACAYYGIFAGLLVGYASLVLAVTRGRWRDRAYWIAVAAGAATSIALVLPFFLPFIALQREGGFVRTLDESRRYSANLAGYLASAAHAHAWLLAIIRSWPRFSDVLFPGFLALGLAALGIARAVASGVGRTGWISAPAIPAGGAEAGREGTVADRETLLIFGSIGLLAAWASFGPAGGLYTVLYHTIPLFSFLRAPARIAPVVVLAVVVLGAIGARALLERVAPRRQLLATVVLCAVAILELNQIPFRWERAPALPKPYLVLAKLPRGPVAEFPFYGARVAFHLHTQYMLFSTSHWFPLVNGYSDYFPPDFRAAAPILDSFPSDEAFAELRKRRVRYVTINWDMFGSRRGEIEERLRPYAQHLRPIGADAVMTVYEVVFYR